MEEELRQQIRQWEEKYNQAVEDHRQQVEKLQFDHMVQQAIFVRGGRNARAITALLDLEALQGSQNPEQAVQQALQDLEQECGYLFAPVSAPAYAPGTGTDTPQTGAPGSLAQALRERFSK